ncbi:MAG TPA: hypothetical protein VFU64_00835 [Gaiellaceae bacterium]|nr:hypothetical protein [Gaiellaceae bacterium]
MRAIAIGAAVFLIVVATASGSRAQTQAASVTQKAIEAPLPAGAARKKGSSLSLVRCASASGCVATGSYRTTTAHFLALAERGGKWTPEQTPSGVRVFSLACPAVGRCAGTSGVGEQSTQVLTQSGRTWQSTAATLPEDASTTPWPDLSSVSCGAPGDCAAVGSYQFGFAKPLVVSERGGTWLAGTEPQPPANAATARDPNIPTVGNPLSLVACPSSGNCTAVGTYTNKDAKAGEYPWVLGETAGHWGSGVTAQLPSDANLHGQGERGGTAPFFGFTGLSCPSAANCTAVGGYWGRVDVEQGLILTERNGTWSRGVRAPLPRHAVPNNEPNEFNSPITSVSCAAPDDCAAVGWYVLKPNGTHHGLLLTEHGGTWKASALALPAGAKAPGGVFLTSVTCPSRGNCVAIGYYGSHGKTYGLIARERGGKWGRGITAAVPRNAAAAAKSHTFLNAVSCASAGRCNVAGTYADRSGADQGLILSLRLR